FSIVYLFTFFFLILFIFLFLFFFSSRRRHTRSKRDWSSDVCSSDLPMITPPIDLSLFLFVFWIFANHHNFAFSFDDFAFFTNRLHRCSYFHRCYLLLYRRSLLFITVRHPAFR